MVSLEKLLKSLWQHITLRRKFQFGLLIFLMIIVSLFEIISIGAVVPFLGSLMNPERVVKLLAAQGLDGYFSLTDPSKIILPMTLMFGFFVLLAGALRLLLLYVSTRLSFSTGSDISMDIYRKTLYRPYEFHMNRNSSEVIDAVSTKANGIIYNIISPFLMLISSMVMLIIILSAIVWFQPKIALSVFFGFGIIYLAIILLTKNKLLDSSQKMARYSTRTIKSLQEGLGGIRDIIIDGTQELHCNIYRESDKALRAAQGNVQFISHSPRYAIETLGLILMTALVYSLSGENKTEMVDAIPILGALALCAQRLLPLLQQSYLGWTTIRGGQYSLFDTVELLNQKIPDVFDSSGQGDLIFESEIQLNNITFKYDVLGKSILKNFKFKINKGTSIGVIGETGSGKSTLLDLLMGLVLPTSGEILVDGRKLDIDTMRAWQKKIAHVPQFIYLSDSTVAENIAFGVPKDQIDMMRVRAVAGLAHINTTIEGLAEKYETMVGERGVRLSGGQRQRIGIARALYKRADILILDEATSALDQETEKKVMKSIIESNPGVTMFVVAHRLKTLENCSNILSLQNGQVQWFGTYIEMLHRIKQ